MTKKSLKVVYMGTPEFAVAPLKQILASQHEVVGVVTVADKPAGRGRKIHTSAVKDFAAEQGIPVLQPEKLKDDLFLKSLSAFQADVFVVVAFRMLPKAVWQMPKLGTFNLHASLLPQYRGAAPINWAVINGEKESGVTTFLIDEKIDTGNILLQQKVILDPRETAGTLHDKLKTVGANLVVETLNGLAEGNLEPKKQSEAGQLKPAPKIFKNDCQIDWTIPGKQIEHFIRGLSPYPGAFTNAEGSGFAGQIKITGATFFPEITEGIGLFVENKKLLVPVSDGTLFIEELQPQGKRKMNATDFINGLKDKKSRFVVK